MTPKLLAFVLLLASLNTSVWASNIQIGERFYKATPSKLTYMVSDADIQTLITQPEQQFKTSNNINLGLQSKAVWIKFSLTNTSSTAKKLYIVLNNPLIDKLTLYQQNQLQLIHHATIGDTLPITRRDIKDEALLYKVSLAANSQSQFYLQAQSEGVLKLPLSIWHPEKHVQHKSKYNLLKGLLLGFLLALVISNFAIFLLTRHKLFILGGFYIACLWFVLTALFGFSYRYFNVEAFWLQQINISSLLLLATALLNPLIEKLLQLTSDNKRLLRAIRASFIFCIIVLFINPWLDYSNSLLLSFSTCLLVNLTSLAITAIQIHNKVRYAKVVFIALLSMSIAFSYSLLLFSGITLQFLTINNVLIPSFFISSILLSYLLIVQFNTQRDEKAQQQHQLIAEVRAKDNLLEETIKIQEQAQEELESKIQERTFELEVTLRELEEKNRALEEKNTHDALTGIRNRMYFDKKLSMEFRRSRREQTPLSVLMMDIDHFKQINDNLGHLAGDEAIKFVANTIKQSLQRPSDEACRYGGEEFTVILPNTPLDGAVLVAQSIRAKIAAATVHTSAGEINMTISAGVYCQIAELNDDPNQHTSYADKALYHAKQSGRNQVATYSDDVLTSTQ